MADLPILFSRPMIHALLAGRKTQTRRELKPKKHACLISDGWDDSYVLDPGNAKWLAKYLRFSVGDRLWVRETWRVDDYDNSQTIYAADVPDDIIRETKGIIKSRPSIFMPRSRSRITLTVTDVRVQRLQDISKDDVIAEGISEREGCPIEDSHAGWHEPFAALWDSINGEGAWLANPWVAAYTFTVHKGNIDP